MLPSQRLSLPASAERDEVQGALRNGEWKGGRPQDKSPPRELTSICIVFTLGVLHEGLDRSGTLGMGRSQLTTTAAVLRNVLSGSSKRLATVMVLCVARLGVRAVAEGTRRIRGGKAGNGVSPFLGGLAQAPPEERRSKRGDRRGAAQPGAQTGPDLLFSVASPQACRVAPRRVRQRPVAVEKGPFWV